MKTQDLEDISAETFAVHNPDGSISLDPYARKTRLELKNRCGELCRALDKWQHIAMTLFEHGSLSDRDRGEVERLIEAGSEMSEWQSIETAPKNTPVIVWVEGGAMGEAYYDEQHEDWWWQNTDRHDYCSNAIYPTLWHPMPKPPFENR